MRPLLVIVEALIGCCRVWVWADLRRLGRHTLIVRFQKKRSLDLMKMATQSLAVSTRYTRKRCAFTRELDLEWKYRFCKNILAEILEATLTAEPPSYQTILDLDRKVREFRLPAHLNMFINSDDKNFAPGTYLKGCLLSQYRTVGKCIK
jgi:hypothetical protein